VGCDQTVQRYAIGVDIGGTHTKVALVDQDGVIHLRAHRPTPIDITPEPILEQIVAAIRAFQRKAEELGCPPEGIGLCVPHFLDGEDWIQRQANSIPALEGYPLRPYLMEALGPSVASTHDLNAAGMAERLFGKGRDYDRMLLMAIGTGISICLITDEQGLIHWSYGGEGDAGMIIVDPLGLIKCNCGGRGCLETVASAPAIRRQALEEAQTAATTQLTDILRQKGDLDARDVFEAAEAGDALARSLLQRAGYFIGVALTTYLHLFRPHVLILGGGVAQAGEWLLEPVRATVNRLASPLYLRYLQAIEVSALGAEGGVIGCASLILHPDPQLLRRSQAYR
jgi:glucokinase